MIRKIARIPLSITRRRGSEKTSSGRAATKKKKNETKKKKRKIGRSGNMTWHRSYRSIGEREDGRYGRVHDCATGFAVGPSVVFRRIRGKYFNRRARTPRRRPIRARETDMRICGTATRVARMCRQTGFDIPCLCNYARPVFGPDAHRIKVHYDNHIRYCDAGHIPY